MNIEKYSEKYNEITRTLLRSFAEANKCGNIVLSPMSIIMLLGITADAVRGKTRDEIINVIGNGAPYDELINILKEIRAGSAKNGSLMSSNAVCVNESIAGSVAWGYPERLKEIFDGKLFSSTDVARDVNAWVKEKTKGMIEKAADESVNGMIACLVNAVAFEADWMKQYKDHDISEGGFNNADGTVSEVYMMESSEESYIEDEVFTGFMKPYKDEKYAFMALLPKKQGEAAMLKALQGIDLTKLFGDAIYGKKVYVTMPEFKYDFGVDLTGQCKEFGINTLFSPEADFSPMSREWLKVDSIIHKAHIEVDRKGTKAAAVTMGYLLEGCLSCMDGETVCLDRPFVYAIMDTETKLPVFAGIYNSTED